MRKKQGSLLPGIFISCTSEQTDETTLSHSVPNQTIIPLSYLVPCSPAPIKDNGKITGGSVIFDLQWVMQGVVLVRCKIIELTLDLHYGIGQFLSNKL